MNDRIILYHFCAGRHLRSIMTRGLVKGAIAEPTPTGFRIYSGWTWLTLDPDPGRQSWATKNIIKYDRTQCRLMIEIPDTERGKLFDRMGIVAFFPSCDLLFDGFPGSENWRVFHGRIPLEWIKSAERINK